MVRGPLVFPGYLDDPELTAASFAGDWFRTGDLGSIDDEGYVHVSGRIKEIINRGGEKISPVEIDAAIESLPGVKEAATFGIAHATLGEEVVAALVRQTDAALDEAQVIEHVRGSRGTDENAAKDILRRSHTAHGKRQGVAPRTAPPAWPGAGRHRAKRPVRAQQRNASALATRGRSSRPLGVPSEGR